MEFKQGDRVRAIQKGACVNVGETGKILEVEEGILLKVRWDSREEYRHDHGGLCEDFHGGYIAKERVVLEGPREIDEDGNII